ncbi:MAG: hypothetical protein WDZ94_04490 [Patescibacteria group bacterium]
MANILVTDLKVVDSPQAGLGVARSLKDAGHKIYGLDDTPFVTTSQLFEKTFVLEEIRTLNLDNLIKKLITYKEVYNIDYLVPCYDETAVLFSFIKEKLDFINIDLIAPSIDVLKKIRKVNLTNILPKKLKTPKFKVINSMNEAKEVANKIKYPVFVKGLTKAAIRVTNDEELEIAVKKICDVWNNGEISCIVQKEIKGTFINALITYKNKKIVAYTEMEKVGLDGNGATWFGKLTTNQNLFNPIKELCEGIGLNDCIMEFETIKNEEDGEYYLYEINPRPPAWVYASALNKVNFLKLFIETPDDTIFNTKEVYFGRETIHFLKSLPNSTNGLDLRIYSKGAAYKNNTQKYPSELMLD